MVIDIAIGRVFGRNPAASLTNPTYPLAGHRPGGAIESNEYDFYTRNLAYDWSQADRWRIGWSHYGESATNAA
jgi:hypothetical protein